MRLCPHCGHDVLTQNWQCANCSWHAPEQSGIALLASDVDFSAVGYEPIYFEKLAAIEEGHFWFNSRLKLVLKVMSRYCPGIESALEVGCGTGQVTAAIAGAYPNAKVTGAELFPQGLAFAQRRSPHIQFLQLDARNMPFRGHFNMIGAFDVIEHIEEDEQVLQQMHQTLKAGGTLVVTVPQHAWLWSGQDELARHERRYSRRELMDKVQAAGFTVRYWTSFMTLLLPILLLKRLFSANTQADDELAINPVLNALFGCVMFLERGLIGLGIKLPIGSSLLLVAKRD